MKKKLTSVIQRIYAGIVSSVFPRIIVSSTMQNENGVRKSTVRETPYWIQEYPIKWDEPKLNLAKLAKLRFIEGLDRHQLAKHFDVSPNIISCALNRMRKAGFEVEGLHRDEKEKILWASQN